MSCSTDHSYNCCIRMWKSKSGKANDPLYAYMGPLYTHQLAPFMLIYIREPSCGILTQPLGYGANDMKFRSTMLQDLVESHNTEAAHRQKLYYNRTSCKQCFKIRDIMWLSILVVENYTLIEMEEYGGVKSMTYCRNH